MSVTLTSGPCRHRRCDGSGWIVIPPLYPQDVTGTWNNTTTTVEPCSCRTFSYNSNGVLQ